MALENPPEDWGFAEPPESDETEDGVDADEQAAIDAFLDESIDRMREQEWADRWDTDQ